MFLSFKVRPSYADVVRFYCSLKRGVTIKELCLRFRQVAASAAVRVLMLDSKYSSSKYSDQSLSSSAQSRTSSNPTTPIKMHTQSLSTRTSLSKRHMGEFQSVLTVIDERKLILFGLLHGLIRRIEKYPVFIKNDTPELQHQNFGYNFNNQLNTNVTPSHLSLKLQNVANGTHIPETTQTSDGTNEEWEKYRKKLPTVYSLFDGSHSFDKICLVHGFSQIDLDDIIDKDPDVVTIWK